MSDHQNFDSRPTAPASEEEAVHELLRQAGPRPAVPAADLSAIKGAAREAWQAEVQGSLAPVVPLRKDTRQRRPHAGRWALAAAAVLVLALGIGWKSDLWRTWTRAPLATVELAQGTARLLITDEPDGSTGTRLEAGAPLNAGVTIVTSPDSDEGGGSASIRLATGPGVRLAGGSRLQIVDHSTLLLEDGAVYFDADPHAATGSPIVIRTALGVVRHIGTQFEARLTEGESTLRVRVREGVVEVQHGQQTHRAERGEELTLHADGEIDRGSIQPYGPAWRWVLENAPTLSIDGKPLHALLRWTAREMGHQLEYQDEAIAERARECILSAPLHVRPDHALGDLLSACEATSSWVGGRLLIAVDETAR